MPVSLYELAGLICKAAELLFIILYFPFSPLVLPFIQ